jgi:sulfide dehydrogenase cytochrome subunit
MIARTWLPLVAALAGVAATPAAAQTLPSALALSCAACHGTDGKSPGSVPAIDGRSVKEAKEILTGFKNGTRQSTVMNRMAKAYSDQEIDALAEYFSKIMK